jgi:hypothetical protein
MKTLTTITAHAYSGDRIARPHLEAQGFKGNAWPLLAAGAGRKGKGKGVRLSLSVWMCGCV